MYGVQYFSHATNTPPLFIRTTPYVICPVLAKAFFFFFFSQRARDDQVARDKQERTEGHNIRNPPWVFFYTYSAALPSDPQGILRLEIPVNTHTIKRLLKKNDRRFINQSEEQ
jgi:hypothetical protein